jgi:hypothetical protein
VYALPRKYSHISLRQNSTADIFKEAEIMTGVLTCGRQNRAHLFPKILVFEVAAERGVCDVGLFAGMRGTKCSCEHSQCRGSLAQATTFDQIGEGFSAILTGVSLRGIAERGHEAKLSANPANSAALSGQKDM